MESATNKKQFGLIIKKKAPLGGGGLNALAATAAAKKKAGGGVAIAFGDDDEDDERVDTDVLNSAKPSASVLRSVKQAERQHEHALAENPNAFDYDDVYEEMKAKRDAKNAEQKAADKERKPKYAHQLMKAHRRRVLEDASLDARLQEKERIAEGEKFADKESFVTGGYRKQMEEMNELREIEARERAFNEMTDVQKQKLWQSGFYRTMLNELSRDGGDEHAVTSEDKKIKTEPALPTDSVDRGSAREAGTATAKSAASRKEGEKAGGKSYRRHQRSSDEDETREPDDGENKKARGKSSTTKRAESDRSKEKRDESKTMDDANKRKEKKKSIYSDGESDHAGDGPKKEPPATKPSRVPGLNKPATITTRSEEVLRRHFTPTPPTSGDEDSGREENRRTRDEALRERQRIERLQKKVKVKDEEESAKSGPAAKTVDAGKRNPRPDPAERLLKLKQYFAQHNTNEQIDEARKRYFQRKANGGLEIPI